MGSRRDERERGYRLRGQGQRGIRDRAKKKVVAAAAVAFPAMETRRERKAKAKERASKAKERAKVTKPRDLLKTTRRLSRKKRGQHGALVQPRIGSSRSPRQVASNSLVSPSLRLT